MDKIRGWFVRLKCVKKMVFKISIFIIVKKIIKYGTFFLY